MRIAHVPIAPAQRCICARPLSSGRRYFGRPACVLCGNFLVHGQEREQLEFQELRQLERERILAAKQAAEAA